MPASGTTSGILEDTSASRVAPDQALRCQKAHVDAAPASNAGKGQVALPRQEAVHSVLPSVKSWDLCY